MTLVGQNLGARRPREAAHSSWVAFGLGCGVMCFMGAIFFVLALPERRRFAETLEFPASSPVYREAK